MLQLTAQQTCGIIKRATLVLDVEDFAEFETAGFIVLLIS